MTDIVERLRGLADEWYEMCGDIHEPLGEAADEIERLRDALREITIPAYEYLSDGGAAKHKIKIARAALEEKE